MEWPKRAQTADWENGVLALDRETQFEVPELTAEIMERLAGYSLVGFHVKGYPVTDELLAPFAGHKSMVNFGVEDGALTDACFPIFSAMPKLRYLLLDGNAAINGSGLSALQNCKLDLLTLNRTGLDDAGLRQAAAIPKLSHIQIDHTAVTYEGLLAIAGNSRIEPVAREQFTREQMEHFFQMQREKAKKPVQLDEQAAGGIVRRHMAWEYETFDPDGQCFEVWQVEIDGQIHRFAAGEFSNCVWGFYLEKNG